ncbi:TonB-dependent receptor [Flavobacterium johnsoniae]|uniref:TonB-dependent receptor n=1 Tax=Flavobacterium johnsoniae (strain ATCC 17061 / DSM 2064 / JCM 8514 / BCRC 14874 / CCUG 350202 / NBRC 14942 / NCIMB 11054 / UW101) TaxID=376686 RepID=A5FIQ6_FLAJ1|nr:TonB-dependent receptor [Flavobacterium johnsoniae]ABQ04919.1 TonB-dependent receptor [Flavobacterium johnsoniae UW101]OXG02881.1 TonB-dependent receptor [Flavobacterium johnsoniae UW101]WQG83282.1 TonB-dependent receptor [Flavobacterium johnsoniae UW101]SHK38953.1 iron complex outermembrane recepter protein [Flavobacterium johnsoniae]
MKTSIQNIFTILFFLTFSISFAQNIEGIVTTSENVPLEAVNVVVKGTTNSAVTDNSGKFIIDSKGRLPLTLLIQYVGYTTAEIELTAIPANPLQVALKEENELIEVVVSSRRRIEKVQDVPIAISVITGKQAEQTGAFNVNRIKELVPSVQLYSSNPRNTGINIRSLGSPFGLTNDGIDPGVGFYVDGVYYARPAATTLDFIDVEQIEVLRGPQGSLFGKNTTSGAFNITTRKPSFTSGADFEVSYGNYSFLQAKASVTGALGKKVAGRLSFSGTSRDGLVDNIATGRSTNTLNNQGIRGQLLWTPTVNTNVIFAADITTQRPDGYAQVVAGVAPTQRAAYRQFDAIIADLNYQLPSLNAFDRKIDQDTPWRSNQDMGGFSLNVDTKIGGGTLTSTTAWRFWNWDPSNDRDFTGLQVLAKSQNPTRQTQITQEVRYAGQITSKISGVAGVFFIDQTSQTDGTEESGNAQWRFSQSTTSNLWKTPGLFEGYGIKTDARIRASSAAVFGQIDWAITDRLHILPGLRYNFDKKDAHYARTTYGGLQTTDPQLLALKKLVYSDQAFDSSTDNTDFSGNITVTFKASDKINAYGTFAKSYKPVGVNVAGLPTNSAGQPLLDLAVIKPEKVYHYEVGVKTSPFRNSIFNIALFKTDIKDFQTNVQAAELGVNRGYLANADKVRVQGVEVDGSFVISPNLTINGAVTYTDGTYVKFTNAPLPLEETGAPVSFKDVSGTNLPGASRWAGSLGGELSDNARFFGNAGKVFLAVDSYARSEFSSSPSASKYLVVQGYAIFNARLGFRASQGLSVHFWGRNLLNKDYYEQLLPAGGNAGQYAGVLGDQRTYGITLKYSL